MKKKYIFALILGLLLVAILCLPDRMTLGCKDGVRKWLSPLQGVVAAVGSRVSETISSMGGISKAVLENRRMAVELASLRVQAGAVEELERENKELRDQLNFLQQAKKELIPCEVIGRDISGWWQTMRLGSGTAQGVKADCAVVTAEGLVGRASVVSAQTTDVLLISDPTCKVAARLTRTGAFGLVYGSGVSPLGRATCRMDFINKDLPVRVGDEVVTSGLGGVFPKGLLIGYVEQVYKDRSGLYLHADILPKADIGTLNYVFVMGQAEDPVMDLWRTKTASRQGGS